MKIFVIFLLGIHMTCAAIHTLQYFYTATSGIPNFPEFISLGMLDGQQTDYYDSKIKRAFPKVDWLSTEGPEYWKGETDKCVGTEQNFKNNINVAMSRFNQSGGVHTNQRMYGCEWDDETGETVAFKQDGYDGEDFLVRDFKNGRWISPVQQGFITAENWNKDRGFIESENNYYSTECIEWLKKYLQYGKSSLQRKVSPQVSLLQKSSSSSPVMCHATGFFPSGVKISWMKNGQEHDMDVDLGELLPNEDGTFQKTSTITVTPDEWKNNVFRCVVEHQGKTIQSILTEDKIMTNGGDSLPIMLIVGVLVAVVLLIAIAGVGYVVYKKKQGFKPVSGSDDGSSNNSAQPQA